LHRDRLRLEAQSVSFASGAAGITVHLRMDRRHIRTPTRASVREAQPGDVERRGNGRRGPQGQARPGHSGARAPQEVTTDGGLNLILYGRRIAADVVEQGRAAGFHAYAGHGLRTDNVGSIAAIAGMAELNIGHFIVARAAIVGMDAAVREMLAAMAGMS
jgi:pyridoxine 5'-phosphate synthase PdxJ